MFYIWELYVSLLAIVMHQTQFNMKKVLVVGASGATGKLLVADLLNRGIEVTAVVRPTSSLKTKFESYPNYQEASASISET